jgi:hypothetical protein
MNPNDQPFSHSREQASRIDAVVAVRQAAHAARRVVIAAMRAHSCRAPAWGLR